MSKTLILLVAFLLLTAHTVNAAPAESEPETYNVQYWYPVDGYATNLTNDTNPENAKAPAPLINITLPHNLETRHYIYGGIGVIILLQIILLVLIIGCRKRQTFYLKPKEGAKR